jgi:hypothetical protein
LINNTLAITFTLDNFRDLANLCHSDSLQSKLQGTIGINKLLSKAAPPIQEVIDAGLV